MLNDPELEKIHLVITGVCFHTSSSDLLRAALYSIHSFQSLTINTLKMVNLKQTSHTIFSNSWLTHGLQIRLKTLSTVNNHLWQIVKHVLHRMNTRNNLKSITLGWFDSFSVWLSFRTRAEICAIPSLLQQQSCSEKNHCVSWSV